MQRLLEFESRLKEFFKIEEAQKSVRQYGSVRFVFVISVIQSLTAGSGVAVSALDLSAISLTGIQLGGFDSTRTLEKLSPLHNIHPDAYLDPVSIQIRQMLTDNSRD